ncbi:MAG: sigma-54 dependent transcriptional regulator [Polyangia bacterium]
MTDDEQPRVLVLGSRELERALDGHGFDARFFESPDELVRGARRARARACVVRPATSGVEIRDLGPLIRRLRREVPFTDAVAWLTEPDLETVRFVFKQGVKDIVLDDDPAILAQRLRDIIDEQKYLPRLLEYREEIASSWEFEGMLSRSQKMWDIFELCVRTAVADATVLILGETGTGKELMARAFHRRSGRSGRFVALNCGAVPGELIDSELFGHTRGAFTGAAEEKAGLFRHADGGTLLLDEIGDIPPPAQHRLLRVLQNGTVRPVGGDTEIPVDVRVIAATNIQLDEAVATGTFREDLLYRLDVVRIVVPPLKERPEDILLLYSHFSKEVCSQHGVPRPEVTDEFFDALHEYSWPGNVRQLQNFTERLILTHGHEKLGREHFERLVEPVSTASTPSDDRDPLSNVWRPDLDQPLSDATEEAVTRVEESYLRAALEASSGRVGEAAEASGISRRTLLRKLKRYGIDKDHYRTQSQH